MALNKWKKLSEIIILSNPWWKYKKDETELPSGKKGEYHYVFTNGASMVIPILDDGRIVMVNQYRYLNDRESLEFPCGGVKDGKTYEQTAVQELEEEAGCIARKMVKVGEFNPYNGVTNEICCVFIAQNLTSVLSTPDETEEFEKVVLKPIEIEQRIANGSIWDGMTIAAWTITRKNVNR